METKRLTIPAAEELLDLYFPVLDHGFVALKDYMGGDEAIDDAARTSYGAGTRKVNERRGLIRTLRRNLHCYTPEMEVLTARGWVRWDECKSTEFFMVPDPKTEMLHPELLELEVFAAEDEELFCFENERMSYAVTRDHRMWFKGKYHEAFEVVRVQDMPKWGHFDPLSNYAWYPFDGESDPFYEFVGFYLGDGSYASKNRLSFHLRKDRKKKYLRDLLQEHLEIPFEVQQSPTYEDASIFYVVTPEPLRQLLGATLEARAKDKAFPLEKLYSMGASQLRGLLRGLMNSDGSDRQDRDQNTFHSSSPALRALFQALNALLGTDAHHTGAERVTSYFGERTTLEARKQYFSTKSYTGKVYCTTTSTGLLVVRGGPDKFGFICGNTSPFEMCELVFHCSMPIFVARQWMRHRTASLNEYSARYSVMPMLFYVPEHGVVGEQSINNKQGRGRALTQEQFEAYLESVEAVYEAAKTAYEKQVAMGVARETARGVLPVTTYTQWYWKIDLHNLLHFLTLRCDTHAQLEIRVFANVIAGMVKRIAPLSFEAWIDYTFSGVRMSRMEMEVLQQFMVMREAPDEGRWLEGRTGYIGENRLIEDYGFSKREVDELIEKLREKPIPSFDLDLSLAKDGEFFAKQWAEAVPKIDQTA